MEALVDYLAFTVWEYEGKEANSEDVISDILNL